MQHAKSELVRSLGADHVIDYTKEDFTKGDQRYDVILDNVANHSLSECRRVLTPEGKYVMIGGGGANDKDGSEAFGRKDSDAGVLTVRKPEDGHDDGGPEEQAT